VRKRERGRLDTIVASGGKKAGERPGRIDAERQRVGNMDPPAGFPPPFTHYTAPRKHWVQRLVSAPPACTCQTLAWGPWPANQIAWVKQVPQGRRQSIPWALRADDGSRVGSLTTTVTASAPTMPTAPR
jgi:hypothetical protein